MVQKFGGEVSQHFSVLDHRPGIKVSSHSVKLKRGRCPWFWPQSPFTILHAVLVDGSLPSLPTTRNKLIANLYLLPSHKLHINILSVLCVCLFGEQLKFNMPPACFHLFNKRLPMPVGSKKVNINGALNLNKPLTSCTHMGRSIAKQAITKKW